MSSKRVWSYAGCVALGLALGWALSWWHHLPQAQATATSERDDLIIATGPVDEEGEAVFVLDTLTGDIKAYVIHPFTGKFSGFFQANVLKDLGIANPKRARFTMVTGQQVFRRGPGVAQMADCVLYVAELSTGRMVAYGLPWNRAFRTSARGPTSPMVRLDGVQFRQVRIRD